MDKFHIRHSMLYESRKYNNAANVTNAIDAVYPGGRQNMPALVKKNLKAVISIFPAV